MNKVRLDTEETHKKRVEKIKKIQFGEDGDPQREWPLPKATPIDLHNDRENKKWNFMTSANTPERKYFMEFDK